MKELNENSVYDVIIGKSKLIKCLQSTELEYLDVLPASAQLVGAEIELVGLITRENMLKDAILDKEVTDKYDYII